MEGWIKVSRRLLNNGLWIDKPFARGQAWIDLIMLAAWQKREFYLRGIKVVQERGEVCESVKSLSGRWGWSDKKVKRFINALKDDELISLKTSNVINKIKIANYEKYQDIDDIPQIDIRARKQMTQQKTSLSDNKSNIYSRNLFANDPTNDPTDGTESGTKVEHRMTKQTTQQKILINKRNTSDYELEFTPNDPTEYLTNDPTNDLTDDPTYKEYKERKKGDNSDELSLNSSILIPVEEKNNNTREEKTENADCEEVTVGKKVERIDYKRIAKKWNEATGGQFGVIRLPIGEPRRNNIRARARAYGTEMLYTAIDIFARDMGWAVGSRWATFDWLFKPTNFEKIISENYKDRTNGSNYETGSSGYLNSKGITRVDDIAKIVADAQRLADFNRQNE